MLVRQKKDELFQCHVLYLFSDLNFSILTLLDILLEYTDSISLVWDLSVIFTYSAALTD